MLLKCKEQNCNVKKYIPNFGSHFLPKDTSVPSKIKHSNLHIHQTVFFTTVLTSILESIITEHQGPIDFYATINRLYKPIKCAAN